MDGDTVKSPDCPGTPGEALAGILEQLLNRLEKVEKNLQEVAGVVNNHAVHALAIEHLLVEGGVISRDAFEGKQLEIRQKLLADKKEAGDENQK